jgi:hypothetical protein
MDDGPRQQHANVWAWVYIVLFATDKETMNTNTKSTTQAKESAQEIPDDVETK